MDEINNLLSGGNDTKKTEDSDVELEPQAEPEIHINENVTVKKHKKHPKVVAESRSEDSDVDVEPPAPQAEPSFIRYDNTGAFLYKTTSGQYIKFANDKYKTKSAEYLDTIAHKMYAKSYKTEKYHDNPDYMDRQERYEKVYDQNS